MAVARVIRTCWTLRFRKNSQTMHCKVSGAGAVLRQAWERYRLPLAITEAHRGCSDAAEQPRWLAEVWREEAQAAQCAMVDLRAVNHLGSAGLVWLVRALHTTPWNL